MLIKNATLKRLVGGKLVLVPITSPSEAWVELLTKHSDRFMVGSDIGANLDRAKMLPLVMRDYRMLLGNLPPNVAKKIASENYLRIFQ